MTGKTKNNTLFAFMILIGTFYSNSVLCQSSKALETIFAIEALDAATADLKNANNAKKRVKSLSQAIQSYEETLAILRISIRDLSLQQTQLQNILDNNENEVMQLLGVLATFQKAPIAGQMLHPVGPLATARSGMIISFFIRILQKNVEKLRDNITTLDKLS